MQPESPADQEAPSKTRRKQEMLRLQQLGKQLLELKRATLDALPLTPELRKALAEYQRLPASHEARRRQLQFIGRVMRDNDAEAIQQTLERLRTPPPPRGRQDVAEQACERILSGGDEAIQALLESSPQLERQTLRNLYLEYSRSNESKRELLRAKLKTYLESALSA